MDTPGLRVQLVALLPRLRRFAHHLCGDPAQGDDLVQAACQRALEQEARWQPGTHLDRWMFRLTRNLHIDRLRATPPETSLEPEDCEALPAPDWQAGLEQGLLLDQVLQALRRLPPPLREVLLLVCVEDFSYREAAESLDLPIGTVMSRLSRARVRLMQELGDSHDAR